MFRFLADENFNGDAVRGLCRKWVNLNLVTVTEVGLRKCSDSEVLDWAGEHQRIVLTFDRATMPDEAYRRLELGFPMPGLFVFNDRLSVKRLMEIMEFIFECSTPEEWIRRVVYLSW